MNNFDDTKQELLGQFNNIIYSHCYLIAKENNNNNFMNRNLWANLYCFNLDNFHEYYGKVIEKIIKYFSVVITYSIGSKIPDYDIIILKVQPLGGVIGSKFCFTKFINDNNIIYSHCLFLHYSSNEIKRHLYFKNILHNLDQTMENITDDIGLITNKLSITDTEKSGEIIYDINNLTGYMNLPNYNYLYSEGNIYIMHYQIVNYIFDNRFGLYQKLNYNNAFDYSWFTNYYNCTHLNYDSALKKFKNEKLFGNNWITTSGENMSRECQLESNFNRIPSGISLLFDKKIIMLAQSEKENIEINDFIVKKYDKYSKPILLIACHTHNNLKLKYLLHNINRFRNYVDSIYIINSSEYKNIIEPHIIKDKSFIINNNLNDHQAHNYLKEFRNSLVFTKTVKNAKKHYLQFGNEDKNRNQRFRDNNNYYNIYFEYLENSNLLCEEKWYKSLLKLNKNNNFIITNDSYIIVNTIKPFMEFCRTNKNEEMIGLLDSYEVKYHYPDFLRWYSSTGIKKWMQYYKKNYSKCFNLDDLIKIIEIGSTRITKDKKAFYRMAKNYHKNIHYDDGINEIYINKLDYPIIKIKRLYITKYENENDNIIPSDFNYEIYRELHPDLSTEETEEELKYHFINYGIQEGRIYKKTQKKKYPVFIQNKIDNV